MTVCGMTRRSLLAATAGAVAGGLARPGGALSAFAAPTALGDAAAPTLFERAVGTLPAGGAGASINLGRNADLVGVRWSGPSAAHVELRFGDEHGRWSPWVSAGAHGHAPEGALWSGATGGDPVWTGGSSLVQLRSGRGLGNARLSCVDVSGGIGARKQALAAGSAALAAALALAMPMLPAGAGQPPIIARRAWAQGMAKPRVAPGYGAVRMAFVHHTENPNGYSAGEVPAMLRAIFAFHRYVNGWNDIGYNFVIDSYGRVFEARAGGIDESVVGAHAGGYNLVSTGIAVLGTFISAGISPAAQQTLERLLAWKLSLHGIPAEGSVTVRVNPAGAIYSRFPANARVSLPRIAGHRDGDSTDCPGDALYGELSAIRGNVQHLAPRPARMKLALATPPAPDEQTVPPAGSGSSTGEARVLTGGLEFLDGGAGGAGAAPIADAAILIQARSVSRRGEVVQERTIAEAVTNAEGKWSLPLYSPSSGVPQIGKGTWLRALCPGAAGVPAAISETLRVTRAFSFAPPVPAPGASSLPTPPAAPPPST
jgi:hypothetical protein